MEGTSFPMPPEPIKLRKIQLRARYRDIRRDLPVAQRQANNQAINAHLEEMSVETGVVRIAAFLPFDGEPDISAALSRLSREKTEIYLPVISARENVREMDFRRASSSV